VAGSRAVVRRDDFVRESIPTESPSQETGSFDRHQAGCSLRTPREQRKWLTQVRVLAGQRLAFTRGRLFPARAPPAGPGAERDGRPQFHERHRLMSVHSGCAFWTRM
jgi:hypothetical protein